MYRTCSKCSPQPHTLRAALCRHSEVVSGFCLEATGKGDGGHSIQGRGGVSGGQVGVRWICAIVNSAGVPWLKHTVHKYACCVVGVNTHTKINVCSACRQRIIHLSDNE